MQKKKVARIVGFGGALCASAALVGFAVSGTGAYFTDSQDGAINAGTGHVKVNTSNTQLNFDNLLPGEYKTQTLDYVADGTGSEDIWLVFPTTSSDGTNPSEAFTGRPDDAAGGGLGRYGHFAVSSTDGASFTSYNLSANRLNDPSAPCPTDANGNGGSNQQAVDRTDYSQAYCPAPKAILLGSDKSAGQGGTATFTFGYTPLSRGQNYPRSKVVSYKIVATQHGVRPDNPNN